MTDESGMISHATAEPLVQHVMNLCKQESELQNFLFLLTSPTYLEQSGDGKNLTCFGEEFVPLFNWQIVVFWVSFEVSSTYMVHICQVQIILLRASISARTFDVIYGAVSSCKTVLQYWSQEYNVMGRLLFKSAPFLFPCTIEYRYQDHLSG